MAGGLWAAPGEGDCGLCSELIGRQESLKLLFLKHLSGNWRVKFS